MKKLRVLGIYTEWSTSDYRRKHNLYGGIGYYRLIKPLRALDDIEVTIVGKEIMNFGETAEDIWTYVAKNFDLVITKHIDNGLAASNMLALLKHFGIPVLIDLDDNFLAVRPSNPAYEEYKEGAIKRYYVSALLQLADGLIVSTEPLKEAYKDLNPHIYVVPNCNDVRDWDLPHEHNQEKIVIGYAGSITHNEDFELIVPALKIVLEKYPNVELQFLGAMSKDTLAHYKKKFRNVKGKLSCIYGTPGWQGYPELLASMKWNIGIAPLIDDDFNRCKSHIKWMEYSMYGWPVVASKSYPYAEPIQGLDIIKDGETGLLCSTTEEWIEKLSRLIESEELRNELSTQAYNYIKSNWQYDQNKHKLREVINRTIECSSQTQQIKTA